MGKSVPSMFGGMGKTLLDKGLYNTWMYQEQDRIQAFAKSYAERIICESFEEVMVQDDVAGSSFEDVLGKVFHLHLLASVEKDLPWFMESGMLTPEQGKKVKENGT